MEGSSRHAALTTFTVLAQTASAASLRQHMLVPLLLPRPPWLPMLPLPPMPMLLPPLLLSVSLRSRAAAAQSSTMTLDRKDWPVVASSSRMTMIATMAMRPFQVSALLVQPQDQGSTGAGSVLRSLSYASNRVSRSPAGYSVAAQAAAAISNECCCCWWYSKQ